MPQVGDQLRCPDRIIGVFTEDGLFEVKCSSKRCGHRKGVVVFHYFDLASGRLVETKQFREPPKIGSTTRKDTRDGAE